MENTFEDSTDSKLNISDAHINNVTFEKCVGAVEVTNYCSGAYIYKNGAMELIKFLKNNFNITDNEIR